MRYLIVAFIFFVSCIQIKELGTYCHMQSPVNIITENGVRGYHQILIHYQTSKERVANLGHTIELDYDSGSYVTYDGLDYQFKHLHFHTPSEHMLNGEHYQMEMHIVHVNYDKGDDDVEYLVIGVFFVEGEENEFLSSFLDAVPKEEGEVFETDNRTVDATEIIPPDLHDFFHYHGSLTTPPYTEAVNWIILKEIKQASSAQIGLVSDFEGSNARDVQFLYDRVIENVN